MLTITQTQFDALAASAATRFETRVLDHWRKCYPAAAARLDPKSGRDLVQHAVDRARSHGLTRETEVCLFADLTLMFGQRFDHPKGGAPWALAILADQDAAPPARLDALWAEARRRAHEAFRT